MPEGQVLEFAGLSKRFGSVLAVDDLTARIEPGSVTGFLGPNGAGKTTTLRMLLGLVRSSSGHATIGGVPYAKLTHPMQTVGAVLEASSFHPGRSAANHLKVLAQASGLPTARVDQALGTVGLADVAGRKVGGYSLGMRQRLGLAAALLGDPGVLVLDEPVNGLDPEGITWIRGLLQELARQGRTVLMSSHLLSEVQQTVDRLLIISGGRLVFQGGVEDLVDPTEYATVVDAPDRAALKTALETAGVPFEVLRSGLTVRDPDVAAVGRVAAEAGVALSLLQRRGPALEEVFFELVNGLRVHPSASRGPRAADVAAAPAEASVEPDSVDAAEPEGAQPVEPEAPAEPAAEPEAVAVAEAVAAVEAEQETRAVEAQQESPIEEDAQQESPIDEDAQAIPEIEPEPAPAEDRAPETAAFAVAATGVIDIIPPAEDSTTQTEDSAHPTEPVADRNEVVAGEPDELPPDDWRHEEKTQSDRDADAFFHSFDTGQATQQGETAQPDEAAADAASRADDTQDGGDRS